MEQSIEIILAEELRLAKIRYDAAITNPGESHAEIARALEDYEWALSRFSEFVNGSFPILQR